jgi:hypothetical protein
VSSLEQLQEVIDSGYTNRLVRRLHKLAYVPIKVLQDLASHAPSEKWGNELYVLEK